jgi:hypothetical protein
MTRPENDDSNTWSDKLKRRIKPEWMVKRDEQHPELVDFRPGHLAWLLAVGSPKEFDTLEQKIGNVGKRAGADVAEKWQGREGDQRANKSTNGPEYLSPRDMALWGATADGTGIGAVVGAITGATGAMIANRHISRGANSTAIGKTAWVERESKKTSHASCAAAPEIRR